MFQSSARAKDSLTVDIEFGTVLTAPPEVTVTQRYIDSHPFIFDTGTHVVAGPDAEKVSQGAGGKEYTLYEVLGREIGNVYLRRDAS